MLKNNKGITLTALVVTIIILLILASVATVSGKGAIEYIKFNNAKAQFQTMQAQANSWYEDYKGVCDKIDKDTSLTDEQKTSQKNEWLNNYGVDIDGNCDVTKAAETASAVKNNDLTGYKYFSAKYIKNDLDIDGISYDFLINISSSRVLLFGGITYQDKTYYSAEDFGINGIEYEDITKKISFSTKTEKDYIVVYNIKFPNNMNISKYNVEYKKAKMDYWNIATADMKYVYTYEEEGKQIIDNNAWKINTSEFGYYNVKITTMSQEIFSDVTTVSFKNEKIKPENYGELVHGYKDIDGNEATDDWQIFYNDGNIWLIAKDYVALDTETKKNINNIEEIKNQGSYRYWWNKDSTTESKKNLLIGNLLTDTNIWENYVDSNLAIYAMGGPSIDLFVNSYNEKYPNEERGELVCVKNENNMYKVGIRKNGVINYEVTSDQNWILNLKLDNLYVIVEQPPTGGKAYAYWLSSPCETYNDNSNYEKMFVIGFNGGILGRIYYATTYGFRPVVCLKSDVEINYNSETGIWNLE